MAADLAGVVIGFALFGCLTLLPGYALGWLLDVLGFRKRDGLFRIAISVPLAIAVGPVVSFLIGLQAAWIFYGLLSAFGLTMVFRGLRKSALIWAAAAWCVWAWLALCDLQVGRRLYFSVIAFDYAVRTAFISSINTFGLPARNPFFYPGEAVGLRYHHYWLIQSALVERAARGWVDARQALVAGTLWCGIGLLATIWLYLRFFSLPGVFRKQVWLAFGLLLVTGLDIVPGLFFLALAKCGVLAVLPPSMEWWNDQVDGWLYTMLWEPHYVAGLIACLFGFLVISKTEDGWLKAGILAGLAFATGVGAAIYVAFVFTVFLVTWTALALWKRWYGEVRELLVAGTVAFVCSLKFLAGLRGPGAGGPFVHWTVRTFFAVDVLGQALYLPAWQTHLANLAALPLNYLLELGFFFGVGVVEWRRLRSMKTVGRDDWALAWMAAVSVLVCTFLRSGVIANNDLGWRGFLVAQFVLLIRGAQLFGERMPRGLAVLALLGAAGTFYDEALLRLYPLLSDARVLPKVSWLAQDEKLGERTYANREAYEWLRAHSDVRALIQQNPQPVVQDTFYGLYANRNTVAEDEACTATFGGDPKACGPLQAVLRPVFAAHASEDAFEAACRAAPAMEFVVVKDTDEVWQAGGGWTAKRRPDFENGYVRIFRAQR